MVEPKASRGWGWTARFADLTSIAPAATIVLFFLWGLVVTFVSFARDNLVAGLFLLVLGWPALQVGLYSFVKRRAYAHKELNRKAIIILLDEAKLLEARFLSAGPPDSPELIRDTAAWTERLCSALESWPQLHAQVCGEITTDDPETQDVITRGMGSGYAFGYRYQALVQILGELQ